MSLYRFFQNGGVSYPYVGPSLENQIAKLRTRGDPQRLAERYRKLDGPL